MREKHRNLFDILRLTAALLVFYAHLYPLFGLPGSDRITKTFHFISGGSLGVAIFFAISGYLVTQSLDRSRSLSAFFLRRALRIFPALAAVLLLTTFVLGPILTTLSLRDYLHNPETLGYATSNFMLDTRFTLPGLFENNAYKGSVNGSLWTLQSEVTLYLLLPIVARTTAMKTRSLSLCALGFGVLYFWCSRYDRDFSIGLFGPLLEVSRNAAIFCVGAVIATAKDWTISPKGIAAAGLMLALTSTTSYGDLSFLVLLPLLVVGIGSMKTKFEMPRGADISYGFYLYAFPIQQATYQLLSGKANHYAMAAAALAISIGFAMASWFMIEKPMMSLRRKPDSGSKIDHEAIRV